MSTNSKTPPAADRGCLEDESTTPQNTAQQPEEVAARIHARAAEAKAQEALALDAQRRVIPDAQALSAWWAGPDMQREYALQVTIRCPHCRRQHHHGFGPGTVAPHCGGPIADTAPYVYRIVGTDQVHIPERPTAPRRPSRKPVRESGTP